SAHLRKMSCERADGLASMAARVLLLARELGARLPELRHEEEGIVAEAVLAGRCPRDDALEGPARLEEDLALGARVAARADEARRALAVGDAFHGGEALLVVAEIARLAIAVDAGIARRVHARRPAERVDLEARVLGHAGEPRGAGVGERLDGRVRLEGLPVLDRLLDLAAERVEADDFVRGVSEDFSE